MVSEAKWYILHTYSGYENKVANDIKTVVENRNLTNLIEDVMVPTETVIEEKDGKKKEYESKLFPCYVYVKMIMTDDTWYVCRNARGVTGFVGPGSKPIPLTDEEIANLGVKKSVAEISFKVGDLVRIVSGQLKDNEGTVIEVDEPNGTIQVMVSMFGRETPATLDISAVETISD